VIFAFEGAEGAKRQKSDIFEGHVIDTLVYDESVGPRSWMYQWPPLWVFFYRTIFLLSGVNAAQDMAAIFFLSEVRGIWVTI
jgi:hypothetical protein